MKKESIKERFDPFKRRLYQNGKAGKYAGGSQPVVLFKMYLKSHFQDSFNKILISFTFVLIFHDFQQRRRQATLWYAGQVAAGLILLRWANRN